MFSARVLGSLVIALVACKGDPDDSEHASPRRSASKSAPAVSASASPASTGTGITIVEPSGPRYLRPTSKGVLVDAYRFPSVPASMVEQEVGAASTRRDVAGVLRRFGLLPLEGSTGSVWIANASLVDRSARERLLVASFRGDESAGMRDEDTWIVFLGSTEEDRLLKIDSVRVKGRTKASVPIEIDARELHASDFDDVVATWSSCTDSVTKACHRLQAWTMQRGHPELVLDASGDSEPTIAGLSAPHDVIVDGRRLAFDPQTFTYR